MDKTDLYIITLFTVHVYDCVQQDRQKFLELLEKRAKKRQKLLSMKRHSSLLKRPEILETVYSVEVCVFSFRRSILFVCTC